MEKHPKSRNALGVPKLEGRLLGRLLPYLQAFRSTDADLTQGNGPQNRVFPRSVGAFWHCGHFVGVSSVAKFLRVMGFRPYFFLALWLDTWALVIVPSALWAVWWQVKVQVLLPRL